MGGGSACDTGKDARGLGGKRDTFEEVRETVSRPSVRFSPQTICSIRVDCSGSGIINPSSGFDIAQMLGTRE